MLLDKFDYNLPPELIAQTPADKRDHSRLLVYKDGQIEHKHFFDLIEYLQPGDVLVLNDSKVFPARLLGKKQTGGRVEVFLLKEISSNAKASEGISGDVWECLIGHTKPKIGLKIFFKDLEAEIVDRVEDGWLVKFNKQGKEFNKAIDEIGKTPLPPYIKTEDSDVVRKRYQTVYADKYGSVAAPTAGLHFTDALLQQLKDKGIIIKYVTLHVGLGTFAPVKVNDIIKHKMHSEYYEVDKTVWDEVQQAKKNKKRVVSVGTTATRVLESVAKTDKLSDWTDIYIYPGYKYQVIDSLVTNFHLPKSTLLMLVSALLENKGSTDGVEDLKKIYQEAIDQQYRFYSFGDAMLIM